MNHPSSIQGSTSGQNENKKACFKRMYWNDVFCPVVLYTNTLSIHSLTLIHVFVDCFMKKIAKMTPKPYRHIMPRVRRKSATCQGFCDFFAIVSISNQTTRTLRPAIDLGETHHARRGFVYNTIGQDTSFQGITMQCMCVNTRSTQFDNIPTLPMLWRGRAKC